MEHKYLQFTLTVLMVIFIFYLVFFQSGVGYRCQGDLSEWTKCQVKTVTPARKKFKIPEEFRLKWDFM